MAFLTGYSEVAIMTLEVEGISSEDDVSVCHLFTLQAKSFIEHRVLVSRPLKSSLNHFRSDNSNFDDHQILESILEADKTLRCWKEQLRELDVTSLTMDPTAINDISRNTQDADLSNNYDMEMTDSSSQSDDTSGGGGSSNGGSARPSSRGRNSSSGTSQNRRRKGTLNAKERNLRRLESNERERMRMHSLNDAFQPIKKGGARGFRSTFIHKHVLPSLSGPHKLKCFVKAGQLMQKNAKKDS
uniref:BHLH domain-containing protein n=1 Tax=Glossina austeni TaxID=7395 RepID=A0A1A9UEY6_GLOAU